MSEFFTGDMVEVVERGKVRAKGQIRNRARWSSGIPSYYLILPEGALSLAEAITAHHDQLRHAEPFVANENFRAAGSVI